VWCQIFSMSSQLVTIPCSMGSVSRSIHRKEGKREGKEEKQAPPKVSFRSFRRVRGEGRGKARRTLEGKDTTLGLSLVTYVRVLLAHADHDTLMTGPSDDGGEHLQERVDGLVMLLSMHSRDALSAIRAKAAARRS
jgi:hypothetical protein